MPLLIILSFILQIACAIHVINTGRDKYWIWLIIIAPGIGCLIYLVTQVLPDAGHTRTGRALKENAVKALDPNREYREAFQAFDMLESTENRIRLADALINLGKFEEAETHVKQCLTGAHATDPHILQRASMIALELGLPETALNHLDTLQKANPGYQSQDCHLIYAMALEAAGRIDDALASYSALTDYATGEEARVRFGNLLIKAGHIDEAKRTLEETIKRIARGTKHYKKTQKQWKYAAEKALASL